MKILEEDCSRLEQVLSKDKAKNPNYICDVLRSDIQKLVRNYMDDEFVSVSMKNTETGYSFDIQIDCARLKSFGFLPY